MRWFDDLAVMVTFRQTDPLYAIDLTDPAHPRVLGDLKIPGFSAYLHPLGGTRARPRQTSPQQYGRPTAAHADAADAVGTRSR